MNKLPHFVIIGAGKSASTWLHFALRQHPSIFMPEDEIPFFEDPYYDASDLTPLHAALDQAPTGATIGIKRPNYLCTPECAPRLAKHLRDARLIAILRNPVDRAISQYYHLIRSGRLPVAPADKAFSRYLAGEFDAPFTKQLVLEFGLYAKGIANFWSVFPRDQLMIFTDLGMRGGSLDVFRRACRFLQVSDDFVPADITRPRNQGVYFSPFLSLIQSLNHRGQTFNSQTGLETLRQDFTGRVARRLAVLGSRLSAATRIFVRDQEPSVSQKTRLGLLEFYRSDIDELERMIDKDLTPWRSSP